MTDLYLNGEKKFENVTSPCTVSGLIPDTEYEIYVENEFGKSNIIKQKTKKIAVTGVELLPKEVATKVGENTQHLQVKFIPDDATNKNFTLISKDEKIATVNPYTGQITGIAAGETEGEVTTEDGSFVANAKITVVES